MIFTFLTTTSLLHTPSPRVRNIDNTVFPITFQRFFGMMRESCGANDHPDSNLSIQMYRLISTYSLVQSPKGSKVRSSEIFDVLLSIKDIKDAEEKKEQWNAQLNTILDRGCADVFAEAASFEKEHDDLYSKPSEYATAYMAGYVARKTLMRFEKYVNGQSTCEECVKTHCCCLRLKLYLKTINS